MFVWPCSPCVGTPAKGTRSLAGLCCDRTRVPGFRAFRDWQLCGVWAVNLPEGCLVMSLLQPGQPLAWLVCLCPFVSEQPKQEKQARACSGKRAPACPVLPDLQSSHRICRSHMRNVQFRSLAVLMGLFAICKVRPLLALACLSRIDQRAAFTDRYIDPSTLLCKVLRVPAAPAAAQRRHADRLLVEQPRAMLQAASPLALHEEPFNSSQIRHRGTSTPGACHEQCWSAPPHS